MVLDWTSETVLAEDKIEQWYQPLSNRVLDFHGDPIKAFDGDQKAEAEAWLSS